MSRSARSSIPTPTATPTTVEASGPVVTSPPRLVPLELQTQRRKRRSLNQKRQGNNLPDSCGNVGNDVLSCYPTSDTVVVQGEWTRFVWNSRYPEYIGYVNLDIYLHHADSGVIAAVWTNVANVREWQPVLANDTLWGTRGVSGWQDGRNQTMSFYFVAVSAGASIDGGEPRQATFTAIQTRLPDYYYTSLSSVASVSSLASISQSSVSTLSAASVTSVAATATSGPGAGGNGSLQSGAGDSSFPKWAIALLVILGALALAALMLLGWLSARNLRTRQRRRQSTGSSTPIMAPTNQPTQPESSTSPVEQPPASIVGRPVSLRRGGSLMNANDGASTRSGETGPISGQDAAIMASAFRAMLRKPDFAMRPDEEGESPEEKNAREMKEQLAEEGRDIQSVRSERGVRVHTTAEDGSEDGWGSAVPRR